MKKLLLVSIIIISTLCVKAQKKWQKTGIQLPAPICYASDEVAHHFTSPPEDFLKRLKSSEEKTSDIIVTYIDFPEEAETAFEYAVSIWEYQIKSTIPIYMEATWSDLETGVLGSCSPSFFYENFDSAPLKDHYYPIALVEKMEGMEISNSSSPDIYAEFSSNISWYYGTDGNTPLTQYDFVSIVLHEIAHGLGFTGFFYEHSDLGAYGSGLEHPAVFDEYVYNSEDNQLVDTSLFVNHTAGLLEELTSNYLYFKSETALTSSSDYEYPRLYAPPTFDEGSSIYHLNEATYSNGDSNSLMTPFAGKGEAIHNPGSLVMGIFADIGWVYTSIIHEELEDIETISSPIEVIATIHSDSELDSTSLVVVYTTSSFENSSNSLNLVFSDDRDAFVATLPSLENGEIKYYLSVSSTSGLNFRLPAQAPSQFFSFNIGPDTTSPEITHSPIKFLLESEPTTVFEVTATDNIGIETVKIEYQINNQETYEIILSPTGSDLFTGNFNFDGLVDGDSISYRIIAIDNSSNANAGTLPSSGNFTFYIEGIYDAVNSYDNDFNTSTRDFISSDFYIGTEVNFDNGAMHSPHPYPSPDQDDTVYEFSTMLKYPIILSRYKKMTFREIVLVEPGEDESVFGDDDFWDYVIVEGSKNGIDNWLSLVDGYDCKTNDYWETYYNNYIVGSNSSAVGKKGLFVNREINLLENDNFNENDTIFIRFRLFSDPYAHGWGWVIDDLAIQDPPTVNRSIAAVPVRLMVYPNPTTNQLNIQASFDKHVSSVQLSLINSTGQIILKKTLNANDNTITETLDMSQLQTGLYVVNLRLEDGQVITNKILKTSN